MFLVPLTSGQGEYGRRHPVPSSRKETLWPKARLYGSTVISLPLNCLPRHLDSSFCLAVGLQGFPQHTGLLIKLINHACSFIQHPYCSPSTVLRGVEETELRGAPGPLAWPAVGIVFFRRALSLARLCVLPASVLPTTSLASRMRENVEFFLP